MNINEIKNYLHDRTTQNPLPVSVVFTLSTGLPVFRASAPEGCLRLMNRGTAQELMNNQDLPQDEIDGLYNTYASFGDVGGWDGDIRWEEGGNMWVPAYDASGMNGYEGEPQHPFGNGTDGSTMLGIASSYLTQPHSVLDAELDLIATQLNDNALAITSLQSDVTTQAQLAASWMELALIGTSTSYELLTTTLITPVVRCLKREQNTIWIQTPIALAALRISESEPYAFNPVQTSLAALIASAGSPHDVSPTLRVWSTLPGVTAEQLVASLAQGTFNTLLSPTGDDPINPYVQFLSIEDLNQVFPDRLARYQSFIQAGEVPPLPLLDAGAALQAIMQVGPTAPVACARLAIDWAGQTGANPFMGVDIAVVVTLSGYRLRIISALGPWSNPLEASLLQSTYLEALAGRLGLQCRWVVDPHSGTHEAQFVPFTTPALAPVADWEFADMSGLDVAVVKFSDFWHEVREALGTATMMTDSLITTNTWPVVRVLWWPPVKTVVYESASRDGGMLIAGVAAGALLARAVR